MKRYNIICLILIFSLFLLTSCVCASDNNTDMVNNSVQADTNRHTLIADGNTRTLMVDGLTIYPLKNDCEIKDSAVDNLHIFHQKR